jgi:hypothetical protein
MEAKGRSFTDFGWTEVAPCKPYLVNLLFYLKPDHEYFKKGFIPDSDVEAKIQIKLPATFLDYFPPSHVK